MIFVHTVWNHLGKHYCFELNYSYTVVNRFDMSAILNESEYLLSSLSRKQVELQRTKEIEQTIKKAIFSLEGSGRYQILLMVYFCLLFTQITYMLISPSLFYMNPVFTCKGHPEYVAEDEACKDLSLCKLENDYTLTAYVGLYCGEMKTTRNLVQSMVGFGTIVGLIVINYLSDSKGRKFSCTISLFCLTLASLFMMLGAYSKSPIVLMVSQLFAGFSCTNLLMISYQISGKFMSNIILTRAMMIYNMSWGFTQMSLYFFSTSFRQWETLLIRWMLLPTVAILIISFFLLIQDPIFYFNKKRYAECKISLKTLATFNNSHQKLDDAFKIVDLLKKTRSDWESVDEYQGQGMGSSKPGILYQLAPFRNKTIIFTIIGLGTFGLGNNINYYAMEYSMERTGNSFSINVVVLGAAEIIASLLTIPIANKVKRKSGAIFTSFVQASVGILFMFAFVKDSTFYQTIIIFLGRVFGTFAYNFYAFLEVESFPQTIQSLAIGFVEVINQSGKFIAPFLVRVSQDNDIDPVITMSLQIFIFCFFPILIVKETLNKVKPTPETKTLAITSKESEIKEAKQCRQNG